MEGILSFIGVVVGWFLINLAWRFGIAALRAGGRTVMGKGNFSENLDLTVNGMRALEMRLVEAPFDDKPNSPIVKVVEVKGLFPIQLKTNLQFLISVLDVTDDDDVKPVIALLDNFQETRSFAYQHACHLGDMAAGYGFTSWVRVGVVAPDIIQPPFSGRRKLSAIVRLIDFENQPEIHRGFHSGTPAGQLWIQGQRFEHTFTDKGYEEAIEDQEECNVLAIHLAVAVAMIDKDFDDREGEAINAWIKKLLEGVNENQHSRLKSKYNTALKEAFMKSSMDNANLSSLTSALMKKGDRRIKYEVIELCYDVIAADGKMDSEELKLINSIADALELNMQEIQRIKDLKIVKVQATSGSASIEDLLGILPEWDDAKVNKHLRDEFQKWNNRLNTLPEGNERDNAQRMLDAIAESRRKKRVS